MRQIFANTCGSSVAINDDCFLPISGGYAANFISGTGASALGDVIQYIPTGHTVVAHTLYANLERAMGAGETFQFWLYVNGVATKLQFTVTNGFQSGYSTQRIRIVGPAYVAIKGTHSNGASTVTIPGYGVVYDGETPKYSLISGTNTGISNFTSQNYIHPITSTTMSATVGDREMYLPMAGNIKAFGCRILGSGYGGAIKTVKVALNGALQASTALSFTDEFSNPYSEATGLTIACAKGDRISNGVIEDTNEGASFTTSILFESTTDGEYMLSGHATDQLNNTGATEYNWPYAGQSLWSAIERKISFPFPTIVKGIDVKLDNAPGAGKSYTFKYLKNGLPSSIQATVSDTNTTASNSKWEVFMPGDTLSFSHFGTGTPTLASAYWYSALSADMTDTTYFQGLTSLVI